MNDATPDESAMMEAIERANPARAPDPETMIEFIAHLRETYGGIRECVVAIGTAFDSIVQTRSFEGPPRRFKIFGAVFDDQNGLVRIIRHIESYPAAHNREPPPLLSF